MNRALATPKLCTTCGARYAADALFCPSDGTPLSSSAAAEAAQAGGPDAPDPYLGREISGHIEIRQLAGVGAMGRVYRAFQKGIDRDVAVKILHRELSANSQLVTRFHREAKVASRLQHPNVVQVHLAGQLPDGAMYIVMEYLDGLSLQSALAAAGGSFPLSRAMHIALQLCDAAGEAHAQGVVHRDLKPENVMLVRRGEDADYVKVLDFGIARLNWGEQSMATAAGLIFGTARYISPEGAQGEQVGPAGDVYSIATLLYQMLAGRTPFEGDQAVALLVQQIHDPPPSLKSLGRATYVPDAIAQVVMKNLAKDQGARDPDARVLGRALIEAAKASGMSPDELIVRSGLLAGRQSGGMQLPPMQRTRQMELTTELSERLAGGTNGTATKYETPADKPHFPIPSAPTTKWTPPPGFQALLTPPRPPAPSDPRPVDETLDDESAPIIKAPGTPQAASPPNTAPGSGKIAVFTPQVTPQAGSPGSRPASGASAPTGEASAVSVPRERTPVPRTAPGEPFSPPAPNQRDLPTAPPSRTAKPASGVDTTMNDEPARRRRSRTAALILFCFLLGAALAAGAAYRMGLIGPAAVAGTRDEQVRRAEDALKRKKWDTPPGDNVRDLTTEGLARWPGDARLLETRMRAADELVKEALGAKFAGDLTQALHLARLARELDATDSTAQHLVEELELAVGQVAPTISASTVTPLVKPPPPPVTTVRPLPPPTPLTTNVHALLDASNTKPRVGQQVELVAKVVGPRDSAPKNPPEDAHFNIVGPGGAATRLPATADGSGVYRATFTFLEAGKYDVTFNAKADGAAVHSTRTINAGAGAPSSSGDTPPPPAPSGKWL